MRSPFMMRWEKIMPYFSSMLILVISILYITYQSQRWCSLLNTMNRAYTSAPPTTPTGIQLAKDIRGLMHDFHC